MDVPPDLFENLLKNLLAKGLHPTLHLIADGVIVRFPGSFSHPTFRFMRLAVRRSDTTADEALSVTEV